jgi:hypothetical protein
MLTKAYLTFTLFLSLVLLSVSGSGCGAGETADPEGTINLTINYTSTAGGMTLILWKGTDEDPGIAPPVVVPIPTPADAGADAGAPIPTPADAGTPIPSGGGGGASISTGPTLDNAGGPTPVPALVWPLSQVSMGIRDTSLNFSFDARGYTSSGYPETDDPTGGEIADVGEVGGLGDVLGKPAMGWTTLGAVEVGHGYVARFRHSRNYANTSLPYFYARLYVTGWLLDTSDGMIGAKVKYQLPF